MSKYEVKDVVCDYGIYENGKLIPQLILNSRRNALTICDILNADEEHKVLALEEERKHGRWEEDEDKDIYCTNCKHFLYPAEIRMQQITLSSKRLKRKFCPECGAKMDGEENG